jgi:hypothetical protein
MANGNGQCGTPCTIIQDPGLEPSIPIGWNLDGGVVVLGGFPNAQLYHGVSQRVALLVEDLSRDVHTGLLVVQVDSNLLSVLLAANGDHGKKRPRKMRL